MPIRWSALQVSEAMDIVEEDYSQVSEPMEQAEIVVRQARKIPNLPRYIDQAVAALLGEIERVKGGVLSCNGMPYPGSKPALTASATFCRPTTCSGRNGGRKRKP